MRHHSCCQQFIAPSSLTHKAGDIWKALEAILQQLNPPLPHKMKTLEPLGSSVFIICRQGVPCLWVSNLLLRYKVISTHTLSEILSPQSRHGSLKYDSYTATCLAHAQSLTELCLLCWLNPNLTYDLSAALHLRHLQQLGHHPPNRS